MPRETLQSANHEVLLQLLEIGQKALAGKQDSAAPWRRTGPGP